MESLTNNNSTPEKNLPLWWKITFFSSVVFFIGTTVLAMWKVLSYDIVQYMALAMLLLQVLLALYDYKHDPNVVSEDDISVLTAGQLVFLLLTSSILWFFFVRFHISINMFFVVPIVQGSLAFYVMKKRDDFWRPEEGFLISRGAQYPSVAAWLLVTCMTTILPGMILGILS